uniref:Peroxisomal multifunctional enzyme type 2 n=1 Tax=Cacopsylla melanoneura TaxID=428564 RepID=A0A8D9AY98_9HEMI
MPEQLRFDGRVAIVTGAGAGLGRSYALLLAERGASVIVNDLGGGRDGDGKSTKAADTVVNEIRSKGGKAAANYNSVIDGDQIVQTALDNFGRVDIVINNAGILRDRSFARISDTDWDLVHDVHLKGAFKVSRAAWPHMKKQNYGRIVMTSSNSGLLGNFGQANYSAAKMGLVGLSNTLSIEGEKNNIHCNVIVPTAASRLTQDILPPDFFEELRPDLIAPVVAWLCHEQCEENGTIIDSAVGWAAKCHMVRGGGSLLRQSITEPVMLENVRELWSRVTDMSQAIRVDRMEGTVGNIMDKLNELKHGSSSSLDLDYVEGSFSYNNRDAILYALGVGATTRDSSDLKYLYEGHEDFSVIPSYGIIPGMMAVMSSDLTLKAIPGKEFDLSQVLHGEQYLTLHQPLPTQADIESRCKVIDVLDKGKHAVIIVQTESYAAGQHISTGQSCVFIVGGGGFGGQRQSSVCIPCLDPPSRSPDSSLSSLTSPDQAALYRLSGDVNPLHIDPEFARISGHKIPILHGLCSLGFSIRHVLAKYANNDPTLFKSLKVRFVKPVIPGQTLRTDMWKEGKRVHFQTTVPETNTVVISGAYVDLKSSAKPSATSGRGSAAKVRPHQVNAAEDLISQAVYDGMAERVAANPDLVKKVNGVFVYVILKNGTKADTWTADLKKGKVYKGEPEAGVKADTTITVEDSDLVDIALGKLNPQSAFMKGKLKIKGNIMLSQKLKLLMAADSKL